MNPKIPFPTLGLPPINAKIECIEGQYKIFDILRKGLYVLTPEEWVRQHFVHLLIHHFQYPKGLIRLEGGLTYHSLAKRSDILVYDKQGQPFLLVECKSTEIPLNEQVLQQAATYNKVLKAPFICLTNGHKTLCFEDDMEGGFRQLNAIPPPPSTIF
ncbi:MAG: type I restriction enzyme HsdR N-terminal domain-containing protein [Spirosomataceae bacterium]